MRAPRPGSDPGATPGASTTDMTFEVLASGDGVVVEGEDLGRRITRIAPGDQPAANRRQ